MATIISFANQKGGVGKTTLCTTFANFLVKNGESLLVLDCDNQQSIFERRTADEKKYPDADFGYNVQPFDIAQPDHATQLMSKLQTLDGTILLDTPGHLSQQGLVPLFAHSDFIVCPYQYETASINSTITFLKFLNELKDRVKGMHTQLLLIPNRYDKRIGTKQEKELWEQTDKAFSKFGIVLPRIEVKADMQRYNTISLLDRQYEIVRDTFDQLLSIIKSNVK